MRLFLVALVLVLAGCDTEWSNMMGWMQGAVESRDVWYGPELPAPVTLDRGIRWYELTVPGNVTNAPDRIWIALPPDKDAMGCLLMPPVAMADAIGARLGDLDRENLLLCARMGVAAVGFDVPGSWSGNATMDEVERELDRYMLAQAGVQTGRMVLDFVEARLPQVDPKKIYAMGEGLGGTLAIQLATYERRIRAVVAFAPVSDLAGFAQGEKAAFLKNLRPDLVHLWHTLSPLERLGALKCPVLLFHDANTLGNFEELKRFYAECLRRQLNVTMVETMDVDLPEAARQIRTVRAVEWLDNIKP